MTKEQCEEIAAVIHEAYTKWHTDRYRVDFHPYAAAGDLEKQMYRYIADAAYKAVKAILEEKPRRRHKESES